MPDDRSTPSRSSPAPRSRRRTAGPSARTRSSSTTAASTSSRGCPSGARAASRCCSSTASSPARGSGSATSATSPARGWEGHALNLRNHYWSQTADPTSCRSRPTSRTSSRRSTGSGRRPSRSATGWAACSRSRPPSGCRSPASSCSRRSCPRELRDRRPARTSCATCPEVYGRSVIGWATLPEKLQRDHRDLTLADVLRIQHLLGQKPHEAGARAAPGAARACRSTGGSSPRCRASSSAAGSTGSSRWTTSERLAEWLGAEYEPFGAHSHYGLVARRAELPAGRRGDPRLPRGAPALAALGGAGRSDWAGGPLVSSRPARRLPPAPTAPHSSRGPGHRPLKAEITGSNPVCGGNPDSTRVHPRLA